MSLPIGIDLGTTNSVISVYRRGRAETLTVDGSTSVPSAVSFRGKGKGNTLMGTKAMGMAMIRPENTILNVKRKMGQRDAKYTVEGKKYTPVDISSMILKKLCEGQEEDLGGPARNAVITVPAYFTDEQRKDTKLAGEKAGLNVLRLLPEPTAAAIAIGLDKGRDQTILVYDLGGGTFDVSILKVENNDFTVLAVNGDHNLGGNDFDSAIREYALNEFENHTGLDLRKKGIWDRLRGSNEEFSDPKLRQAVQALTTACERVKMELSEAENADLELPNFYEGHHLEISIDRKTFEGLIADKVDRTIGFVLKTVKEAELEIDDIDRLVLVGGSTKIPMIARILSETIKEPFVADNVDLVVSQGAAIMAANLHAVKEGGQAGTDYAPIEVTDVVAHPISVGLKGTTIQNPIICYPVIEKNAVLPAIGIQLAETTEPHQSICTVPVFRGSKQLPYENEYLGELTLTLTPSKNLQPLKYELFLDENGVLEIEGAILESEGMSLMQLQCRDPSTLKVKRRVRATMKLPD